MKKQNYSIYNRHVLKSRVQAYLDEFKIKSVAEITDNDEQSKKEIIFLACMRDFIDYTIDFDLMSSVLGIIWICDGEKFQLSKQTIIEQLCYHAFELQWHLRHDPSGHIEWLSSMLDYYNKTKYKIEGTEENLTH
ncbi:MAG: hypothetical protein ACEQSA_00545 [Weeksellaceae bacterium]